MLYCVFKLWSCKYTFTKKVTCSMNATQGWYRYTRYVYNEYCTTPINWILFQKSNQNMYKCIKLQSQVPCSINLSLETNVLKMQYIWNVYISFNIILIFSHFTCTIQSCSAMIYMCSLIHAVLSLYLQIVKFVYITLSITL